MCGVMAAMAIASMVMTAAATAEQMHAEGQAAKYNAAVDQNNAKVAQAQAQNANALGSYQADQARIRGNLQRGQQMAAMAANNVDVTTGSAADILGDTAMFTSADERQARINAQQRAYGFQVQSLSDQGAGQYALYQGRTQQMGSFLQGSASMLRTGANAYMSGAFSGSGGGGGMGGGAGTLLTGSGNGSSFGGYA